MQNKQTEIYVRCVSQSIATKKLDIYILETILRLGRYEAIIKAEATNLSTPKEIKQIVGNLTFLLQDADYTYYVLINGKKINFEEKSRSFFFTDAEKVPQEVLNQFKQGLEIYLQRK